ncbi:MAG: exopolysaccharide biosynthesis polyprenyl glycosylphosphotransferase [candidate division Zixibacteria bacterium]|nr:exopolysaccharide biosynthesis polyprenyl glycosylphosphotransferase [candidate division Zixibacteria bacterium]
MGVWRETQRRFLSIRVKTLNFGPFLGFLLVWHLAFSFFGLYRSRRFSTRWAEVIDVIKATSSGTLVIYMTSILFRIQMVNPTFIAVFWTASSAIAISSRLMLRYALEQARIRGRNLRHMVIVGTNPRAVRFARKIEEKPGLGYRIIGFVDDKWAGTGEFRKTGYALVADFNDFPAFLRDRVIHEVVIGLPVNSCYEQASRIIALCEQQGIIVRFLSSIFNLKLGRSKTEQFEDDSVITVYTGAMEGWQVLVKRMLDLSLSLILLIMLAPFFFFTALLIKITSHGPVFFIQDRVGLNKRRFRLYKFRTMIPGAEQKLSQFESLNEVSGPVFKIRDDPRITSIGKLLRRTSIDEFPQLVNVLRGDMSLVGPRPLPVRDYNGFDQDWQRRRFSVRPGITCLWQVDGRSDIPFEKWMELDMQYIDQWSLWLDFKILVKTIPAVLKGSGAA